MTKWFRSTVKGHVVTAKRVNHITRGHCLASAALHVHNSIRHHLVQEGRQSSASLLVQVVGGPLDASATAKALDSWDRHAIDIARGMLVGAVTLSNTCSNR